MQLLGHQQRATLTSAIGLTIPAGTAKVLLTVTGQPVRWRGDGTNPTATVGSVIPVGVPLMLEISQLEALRFIETAATAVLDAVFFGG